jgi:hypothetical protein
MSTLTTLPTEVLLLILSVLADTDLLSFFTARRTCRSLQAVITDILDISIEEHGLAIYALITSHFSPLVDSSAAGAQYQPSRSQPYARYATLPWSISPTTREKYLRIEASCRKIPLAGSSGYLVHKLQEIKLDQNHCTIFNLLHHWCECSLSIHGRRRKGTPDLHERHATRSFV